MYIQIVFRVPVKKCYVCGKTFVPGAPAAQDQNRLKCPELIEKCTERELLECLSPSMAGEEQHRLDPFKCDQWKQHKSVYSNFF